MRTFIFYEDGPLEITGGDEAERIQTVIASALANVPRNCNRIITSHIYPPIPIREFDWIAYRDGSEESGPFGHGPTEALAVQDLIVNEE
jgi:hypothetical protein